jgi:hypothetical protein
METEKRFWEMVCQGQSCWEWQGCKDSNGYGRVMLNGVRKRAHRYALIFSTGCDRPELEALHSCDNPGCCNPAHLRWGSHKENMADRKNRKRGFIPAGAKHGGAKLTEDQAARIKFGSEAAAMLALDLNVSTTVIYHIRQGRSWKHIGSPKGRASSPAHRAAPREKTRGTSACLCPIAEAGSSGSVITVASKA